MIGLGDLAGGGQVRLGVPSLGGVAGMQSTRQKGVIKLQKSDIMQSFVPLQNKNKDCNACMHIQKRIFLANVWF